MKEDAKMQMAYLRYAVIAPLLAAEDNATLKQRMHEQADRLWALPNGQIRQFAWGTIEKWLYRYQKGGLDMLVDHPRKDAGSFPGIADKLADAIDEIINDQPQLKTHMIIRQLKERKLIIDNKPSLTTIYRYMKTVTRPTKKSDENHSYAFEAPYPNYLWQVDVKNGPFVPRKQTNGKYKKSQTYLIAVIDDHSRLLCHGQFFFRQDLPSYLQILKTATEKRGLPSKLFCDNGRIFHAQQIKRIAAVLGIHVVHGKPYYPPGRGKIERFFRNVNESFIEALKLQKANDIDELNRRFQAWSESEYNQKIHSAIDCTPFRRWTDGAQRIKRLPVDDDKIFYFEVNRRVGNDATFTLHSVRYETSQALRGETVVVAYDVADPLKVFVRFENRHFGRATILDKAANCNRKRGKRS